MSRLEDAPRPPAVLPDRTARPDRTTEQLGPPEPLNPLASARPA
ncbi:hypothetical protein ACFYNX_14775 [Streptomyces sp. NPDC007872]